MDYTAHIVILDRAQPVLKEFLQLTDNLAVLIVQAVHMFIMALVQTALNIVKLVTPQLIVLNV